MPSGGYLKKLSYESHYLYYRIRGGPVHAGLPMYSGRWMDIAEEVEMNLYRQHFVRKKYREETGNEPVEKLTIDFPCYRSKGQWVLNMDDDQVYELTVSGFEKFDEDYLKWLEEIVFELINQPT